MEYWEGGIKDFFKQGESKKWGLFEKGDKYPLQTMKYMCGRCNSSYYSETDRHLRVRAGKHIGLSPLTFKICKPSKESAIRDHLLL